MAMTNAPYRIGVVVRFAFSLIVLAGGARFAPTQEDVSDAELEKLIQAQVQQLSSGDLEMRRKASEDLYNLCEQYGARARSCVPALTKCLAEEDEKLGVSAEWGLVHCGEPAVKSLIENLASKN